MIKRKCNNYYGAGVEKNPNKQRKKKIILKEF